MVAAINGDFYKAGGVPVHSQLIDGEILKMPVQRDALAMCRDRRWGCPLLRPGITDTRPSRI